MFIPFISINPSEVDPYPIPRPAILTTLPPSSLQPGLSDHVSADVPARFPSRAAGAPAPLFRRGHSTSWTPSVIYNFCPLQEKRTAK